MKKTLFILGLLFLSFKGNAQYENYKMDWGKISKEAQYNAEPEWLKDAIAYIVIGGYIQFLHILMNGILG